MSLRSFARLRPSPRLAAPERAPLVPVEIGSRTRAILARVFHQEVPEVDIVMAEEITALEQARAPVLHQEPVHTEVLDVGELRTQGQCECADPRIAHEAIETRGKCRRINVVPPQKIGEFRVVIIPDLHLAEGYEGRPGLDLPIPVALSACGDDDRRRALARLTRATGGSSTTPFRSFR